MSYSVYYQEWHHRWAGYGVPGLCDHPKCGANIARGIYFKCEEHLIFSEEDLEEENPISAMGCDLFFCERHQGTEFEKHWDWEPKPDRPEWMQHMLTHDSWAQWREKNPADVASLKWQIAELTDTPDTSGQ